MFRKIIWQLIFSYLLVILFAMGITGFFLLGSLEKHFINTTEVTLSSDAQIISRLWESHFIEKSTSMREKRFVKLMTERLAWQSASRVRILDRSSLVLFDTASRPEEPMEDMWQVEEALKGKESIHILGGDDKRSSILSLSYPIRLIRGTPAREHIVGVVYITRSLAYVREILGSLKREYGVGFMISLVVLLLLSFLLSAYISGPIREMTRSAERIAEGDLSHRIPRKRGDEIGVLAKQFDYMREKLKLTLDELMEEKNKLSLVLSTMADGVLVFSSDGQIIMLNTAARKLLGTHEQRKERELFMRDESPFREIKKLADEALRSGQEGEEVVRGFPYNRVVEVSYSPLSSEQQELPGLVMILHDITELQRLDEMKTEFVSNVSHELKTPLASIKGFAELMIDGAIDDHEKARSFLLSIDKEVDRLTRLVKSLLDLSRMESGLIRMEVHPLDISALVEGVLVKLSPQAKSHDVGLKSIYMAHPIVLGNSDRVEQVLINLVDNALRYAPQGSSVSIEVGIHQESAFVSVKDEGIGLREEDQKRVFDRFYRVDKARSRDHGGSGLGLAITKQIIENLGGRIGVESTPGKSCTFSFSLPLDKSGRSLQVERDPSGDRRLDG
ncbi:MAG: ATP-binding protein [Vulcanimicrobiota bacterium]